MTDFAAGESSAVPVDVPSVRPTAATARNRPRVTGVVNGCWCGASKRFMRSLMAFEEEERPIIPGATGCGSRLAASSSMVDAYAFRSSSPRAASRW